MDDLKRFLSKNDFAAIGICGRAGSGKTTLAQRLAASLQDAGIQGLVYSGDYRFLQDSEARAAMIKQFWAHAPDNFDAYVNQFSWWDFAQIHDDLQKLLRGIPVLIEDGYDRTTGSKGQRVQLVLDRQGPRTMILYENAILGHEPILELLDAVLFLTTSDETCLARVLEKDRGRKRFDAILARTLITHFSESLHYQWLQQHFRQKLFYLTPDFEVAQDQRGYAARFEMETAYLSYPVDLAKPCERPCYRGSIFCDLDGTLVKHIELPSATGDDLHILPGTVEKLRVWREAGFEIILTTGRTLEHFLRVQPVLRRLGILYDRFLCDLPIGPRVVVNDNKNQEVRAISIALARDEGIAAVNLEQELAAGAWRRQPA